MPALMALAERHGLAVVEDCVQSHGTALGGRALGSFGHAAAYSFYPTRNLGCVGDGGAVLTKDAALAALAARLRRLSNHGFEDGNRISRSLGFNSRLDELQAAILLALLPHLESGNAERRLVVAARYRSLLARCGLGLPPDSPGCVYHQLAIACDDRDQLMRHLARRGIGNAVHYAPGLHRHPAFMDSADGPSPATEALSASLLSLPIQPDVAMAAVEHIAGAVEGFASHDEPRSFRYRVEPPGRCRGKHLPGEPPCRGRGPEPARPKAHARRHAGCLRRRSHPRTAGAALPGAAFHAGSPARGGPGSGMTRLEPSFPPDRPERCRPAPA